MREQCGGCYMCYADKYIFDVVGGHGAGGLKGGYVSWMCQHGVCGRRKGAMVILKRKDCHRGDVF